MILPPTPIDNSLHAILVAITKESPVGSNRSDVIRWGIESLKKRDSGFHYEPEKPMRYKTPSVVVTSEVYTFLAERKRRFGIPITQSIRDAIYSIYQS